ncbi:intracellular septation protein [Sphingomonas laterariae]|uniref:Inner membrane-spanning protein YciB n=1 Tax=Edaphosphingomonas laterariae TaxID=861865 RepID=A0A239HP40_9SPHN|nr:septation protein IspZ [Sphingomonas laterariae]SNS83082.1 intracellular septation protein [Sphingomonas laterariae]
MTDVTAQPTKKKAAGGLGLALDFGPLLIFFLAYKFYGVFIGTGVFMVAILAALLVSKIKLGHVSPMLWLTAVLVIGFGGLTIYLHDERFIQIKPTIIYTGLAGLLFVGLWRGKPMLKYVLEAAYDGLSETGWLKLSRNWAWFFLAMAAANEVLRYTVSFGEWLTIKTWGLTIVSIIFGIAQLPMLMKHGLAIPETDNPPVPPQG